MRGGAFGVAAVLVAGALPAAPGAAVAQSADLDRVESLMSGGRFASARERLQDWMDAGRDGATREDVQRGLWLKALLTVDAQMAEADLQRLVVEYRGGPFSDAALLRLAQVARARSDPERAERRLEILLQDYPQSPHADEARSMLAELREMPRPAEPARAAVVPRSTEPAPGVPPERTDRVAVPPEPPPPAPEDSLPVGPEPAVLEPGVRASPELAAPTAEPSPAPPGALPFTVQLGAFSTESRAQTLAASADASGFDVRVVHVQGSDLIHVRTGAFASREEADARASELRDRGLPALVAMDRAAETPLP